MTFTRPSVQTELDRFFKAIAKSAESFSSISKSAFTQSRKKLKPEAFVELSNSQLSNFVKNAPNKRTWKGKRVVAIDGSLLNLPFSEELRNDFGFVKNQYDEIISARCSFAYDVCNELVLDAKIDRRKSCEKDLAFKHLNSLNPETDIIVFDRGYPCQWLIGLLIKNGFKFCFRLSSAWKMAHKAFDDKPLKDIDWTIVHRSHKGLDKLKKLKIPKQIRGLRLLSIDLISGEKEVLLTNLTNRDQFGLNDMKYLYHLRWGVEEGFKSFKKVLHIEYFTGKTTKAIKQDVYAKVFMLNLSSMIRTQGLYKSNTRKSKKRKHKIKANKTQVLAKTKDFLVDIFYSINIRCLINQMIKILSSRMEIVRPDRSFPRIETSSRRRYKNLNSKGI